MTNKSDCKETQSDNKETKNNHKLFCVHVSLDVRDYLPLFAQGLIFYMYIT